MHNACTLSANWVLTCNSSKACNWFIKPRYRTPHTLRLLVKVIIIFLSGKLSNARSGLACDVCNLVIVSYFEIQIICFYNSTTTMCSFGFVGPQTMAIFTPIVTRYYPSLRFIWHILMQRAYCAGQIVGFFGLDTFVMSNIFYFIISFS